MDNRRLDIMDNSEEALEMALRIAFGIGSNLNVATHALRVPLVKRKGFDGDLEEGAGGHDSLLLFTQYSKPQDAVPLIYPMECGPATSFIKGWLEHANPGPEPRHDGDNARNGWRVFNKQTIWGRCNGAFVVVQRHWAWLGK